MALPIGIIDHASEARAIRQRINELLDSKEARETPLEIVAQVTELKEKEGAHIRLASLRDTPVTQTLQPQEAGPEESKGGKYASRSEWAKDVVRAIKYNKVSPRLQSYIWDRSQDLKPGQEKDLAEGSGEAGGYTVPIEYTTELLAEAGEGAIARPRASIQRMSRREIRLPTVDQTGTTSGQFHWYGGMVAYWEGEADEIDTTDMKFKQVSLVAHKLTLGTKSSNELLDDNAVGLEDFLFGSDGFVGLARDTEDLAFLNGDGIGKPLGALNTNNGALETVDRDAIQFSVDDIARMYAKFHMRSAASSTWLLSRGAVAQFLQIAGPSGNASYIILNPATGLPMQLLGIPVIVTEKLPTLGTAGDLALIDWSFYKIGDRRIVTLESSTQAGDAFYKDQTFYKMIHRVGGQPWLSASFTLQNGTDTISPFVRLGASTT